VSGKERYKALVKLHRQFAHPPRKAFCTTFRRYRCMETGVPKYD
jgi:hypothetical protein